MRKKKVETIMCSSKLIWFARCTLSLDFEFTRYGKKMKMHFFLGLIPSLRMEFIIIVILILL
jgi:hypothetical protein